MYGPVTALELVERPLWGNGQVSGRSTNWLQRFVKISAAISRGQVSPTRCCCCSTTEIRRGATLGQIQSGAELRGQGTSERSATTDMSIVGSPWRAPAADPETYQ